MHVHDVGSVRVGHIEVLSQHGVVQEPGARVGCEVVWEDLQFASLRVLPQKRYLRSAPQEELQFVISLRPPSVAVPVYATSCRFVSLSCHARARAFVCVCVCVCACVWQSQSNACPDTNTRRMRVRGHLGEHPLTTSTDPPAQNSTLSR
jgi:hypothetical protein